jgi:signal transduction histidine kinase
LRTPLNAIIGFSKIIKEAERAPLDAAKLAEYSGFIFDSANGLLGIVNDIIAISKLQSGTLHLESEPVDADRLVRSCASWALTEIGASGKRLTCTSDDNLPFIDADPEHLKQVLMRLLSNAITFTPEGGHIVLAARTGPGHSVILSVSDTGIGMSAEQMEDAMRPFGQNDRRLARDHGGTGLGLPISKAVVEQMGGSLLLRSTLDKGTDAVVMLPASRHAPERGIPE